jgi:two-component system, OmpR family, response regulator VicR
MTNILYVEDDVTLSFVTLDNLREAGYKVDWVNNGTDALKKVQQHTYDICILDVMLPQTDGFTVAGKIREKNASIPIIFVTARSTKEDKIHGLKLGGDDYITKPFSMEELKLKIEIFLKRRSIEDPVKRKFSGKITATTKWNPDNQELMVNDKKIVLTHREAKLFELLLQHHDSTVKREDILIALWGHDHFFSSRSLDVFVSRLRKYLVDSGMTIENLYNVGYRLKIL